jgi:hypothetical protein
VGDHDVLGGPAWSKRFEAYLLESPRDPLRIAWAEMSRGSMFDRAGARFLFCLASCDFDPRAAGLAMCDAQGRALVLPEFSSWYAEKAIDRLRERMDRLPDREKPSGARILEDLKVVVAGVG